MMQNSRIQCYSVTLGVDCIILLVAAIVVEDRGQSLDLYVQCFQKNNIQICIIKARKNGIPGYSGSSKAFWGIHQQGSLGLGGSA